MFVKSTKVLSKTSPVFIIIQDWVSNYIRDNKGLSPNVSRLLADGIVIGFDSNDFINPSCYKGFIKLYKCNRDEPQFLKRYCGKNIGKVSILGFKIVDYDSSKNYLLVSKMEFLTIIKNKMMEEFPEYPSHLYLGDDDVPVTYIYNREWEHIKGLTPQEKIVLANKHDEEPFLDSYYENDIGMFSKRTQTDEYNIRLESNTDIKDYGDYQEFSDIYTRTKTSYEDYELYPIRVNCLPKAINKKGKSPYDTKLGVLEYRWFNKYQKPIDTWAQFLKENPNWKIKSPKYNWEMNEEEKLANEYDLPENFWEEIEMAYQQR